VFPLDCTALGVLSGFQKLEKAATEKRNTMKKRSALIGPLLLASGLGLAHAGTLLTTPIIFVQPSTIDFGKVEQKQSATNSFVVENVGSGTLVGRAEVPPPFKVTSGATYKLRRSEIQIVTVVYAPNETGTNVESVKFTGAVADASATVRGKGVPPPPWYRVKRK